MARPALRPVNDNVLGATVIVAAAAVPLPLTVMLCVPGVVLAGMMNVALKSPASLVCTVPSNTGSLVRTTVSSVFLARHVPETVTGLPAATVDGDTVTFGV